MNKRIASVLLLSVGGMNLAYWFEPLWLISFGVFVPLFFALGWIVKKSPSVAFCWGLGFGALFFIGGLPILASNPTSVQQPFGVPVFSVLGGLMLFFMIIAAYGIIFGCLFLALRLLRGRYPNAIIFIIFFPIFWVGAELVIREITFGFEWWAVGMPLVTSSVFRQLGGLGGASFLVWFLILTNVALYFLLRRQDLRSIGFPLRIAIFLVPVAGILYAVVTYPSVPMERPSFWPAVALLQTNQKYPSRFPIENDPAWGTLAREALERGAEVIVFPGQITPRLVGRRELSDRFFQNLLGATLINRNATLIFDLSIEESPGIIYQTMIALRQGHVLGEYRKEVPFPVSDYLPKILRLMFPRPDYVITPYIRTGNADRNGILTDGGLFGAAICNETFSAAVSKRFLEQRTPILIVSGSDDAFFLQSIYSVTLRAAQLRAAEGRMWVLRAYKTGISAVIAPNGDVVAKIDGGQRGIIYFGPADISVDVR